MRTIEVKATALRHVRSQYHVELGIRHIGSDFGLAYAGLGYVVKVASRWEARVSVAFRTYTAHATLVGFRTMREALAALQTQVSLFVAERFAHQVNEAYDEAHALREVICGAQARADRDAAAVLEGNEDNHALLVSQELACLLSLPTEEMVKDLKALPQYLRDSIVLSHANTAKCAYVCRMIEHELIRRAEVEQQYANAEL